MSFHSEVMELPEVAALLKCTPETLSEELRTGNLPGAKFGREWIIPRAAFLTRLNEIALEEAKKRREPEEKPVFKTQAAEPNIKRKPGRPARVLSLPQPVSQV